MLLTAVKYELGEEYYKAGVRALSWGYNEREIISALGELWGKWDEAKGSISTYLKLQLKGIRSTAAREMRTVKVGRGRRAAWDTDEVSMESLDSPSYDDEGGESDGHNIHGDTYLAPDEVLMRDERDLEIDLARQSLNALFDKAGLKERERMVLLMRAQDKSLQEIGDVLGLTRERVRQIEAKAWQTLKQ